MQNRKKRRNTAGFTAYEDIFAVTPSVIPVVMFPDIARKRVLLERPAPAPTRRTCPYCGGTFEDYTQRWNTVYDRPSCKSAMYRFKRRAAITLLAQLTRVPETSVEDIADTQGLPALESLLAQFGYHFEIGAKQWCK